MNAATVLPLDALTPEDAPRVGGKAWNCARLRQHGFLVPDGLVIPAGTDPAALADLARHPWFDRCDADARFAVRSSGLAEDSAASSFAGINETRLNVARADVPAAAAACLAAAASPRALAYRTARHVELADAAIAVLIQRMIDPLAAGVAFTVDPVTGSASEIVINAAPGLGEALVSGEIEPDEIRVMKRDGAIVSYVVAAAATRALLDDHVAALVELLIRIERFYGAPQDVEWCFDGAQFWIVQSRPVTGVGTATVPSNTSVLTNPTGMVNAPATPAAAAGPDGIEWSRANLAEVLPELTSHQALVEVEQMLNEAERRHFGGLLAPESELGPLVKAFHGRLYFNLSQFRHLCAITGTPPAQILRSMGHPGTIHPEDEVAPRPSLRTRLASVPDIVRLVRQHITIKRLIAAQQGRVDEFVARLASSEPASLPDAEVWSRIAEWRAAAPGTLEVVLVLGAVLFHEQPLQKICDRIGFPFDRLLYSQLAAGERSISAQQAFDLVELADCARRDGVARGWFAQPSPDARRLREDLAGTSFLSAFDRFLAIYGHRGPHETDWAIPRYHEDPQPIVDAIRLHVRGSLTATAIAGIAAAGTGAAAAAGRATPVTAAKAATAADRAATTDALPARDAQQAPAHRGSAQSADDIVAAAAAPLSGADVEAAEIWRDFESRLSPAQRWTLLPRARRAVKTIKQYYIWRERCRFEMMRVLDAVRRWHLALATHFAERRWIDERDDYFCLTFAEIASAIDAPAAARTELGAIVERRKAERARHASLTMPLLMHEDNRLGRLHPPPEPATGSAADGNRAGEAVRDDGDELHGLPVSRGTATGEVVVLHGPTEFGRMKRGAILVARATDPSWTPLFTLAAGVIVEVGGVLSHASTVAREYGLPAIANVRGATSRLHDGDIVTMDAATGVIRRTG